MKKYEEQLSADAALLNKYLSQYKVCLSKKETLEQRRNDIIREFDNPLNAVSYDGMPKGSGGVVPIGCAAISYRLDEINERIKKQLEKAKKALTEILDMIEFLPENSTERSIIEHRYIDRYHWERICKVEHMSRTPVTRQWRKGLYELLEFKKVQQILRDYKKQLEKEQLEKGE